MENINGDISLKSRKKLPKDIKFKRNKIIFINLLLAICAIVYFGFLNLGLKNIEATIYIEDLKVFSTALLIVAIILFEKGYKNDNESIFLYGIEILVAAFITIMMQHKVLNSIHTSFDIILSLSFLYFSVYYIIKGLILARKTEKKHVTTDIRELVKKDEK